MDHSCTINHLGAVHQNKAILISSFFKNSISQCKFAFLINPIATVFKGYHFNYRKPAPKCFEFYFEILNAIFCICLSGRIFIIYLHMISGRIFPNHWYSRNYQWPMGKNRGSVIFMHNNLFLKIITIQSPTIKEPDGANIYFKY